MLLYLTSNENLGIFDFLQKEKAFVIKKLSGEFALKDFVIHDMRSLSHNKYFAIDVKALKDKNEDIIEAIKAYKLMYDSRIIIFAEGLNKNDELISMLLEEKIYNIVVSTTVAEINEEILKCISDIGKTREDWIDIWEVAPSSEKSADKKYIFEHKNVRIAVAGASRKSGVTTTAFNLVNYLTSIEAKASYTEANSNNHLVDIAAYYEFSKYEDNYKNNGTEYYLNNQFPDDYNFNVFDLGVLDNTNTKIFESCDVKILCSFSKPYEVVNINDSVIVGADINILFSLATHMEKAKLMSSYENKKEIYFPRYSPNLFDGITNEDIFRKILSDYIIEFK